MVTKGEWKAWDGISIDELYYADISCEGTLVARADNENKDIAEANVNLIVAAVNSCKKINEDNPMAVAESIGDMYEALKAVVFVRDCCHEEPSAYVAPHIQLVYKALAKAKEGKE